MTEPTARPELPEGPWNYDYHGDWSTYAMGLEGTVRVEFEQIHEDDKIAISDLFEQAPCLLDELQAGDRSRRRRHLHLVKVAIRRGGHQRPRRMDESRAGRHRKNSTHHNKENNHD